MQKPFWKEAKKNIKEKLLKDFEDIINSCYILGIKFIVIPLVDNGRLESIDQENELIFLLRERINLFKKYRIEIIFESDYDPHKYKVFIQKFPKEYFGINYDTGNSASLGFDPVDEFRCYGDKIKNVHIKDRELHGSTVALNTGNVNFKEVFKQLKNQNYSGNLILQTARATDNNHSDLINKYKLMIENFILE